MLNEAQKQAVEALDGPVRIIGGAGTGKTHTLIARMAHLIDSGTTQAPKILAISFTNTSAHEMNERLHLAGHPRVTSTTFHGLAALLLRQIWKPDFRILTAAEQTEALRAILYSHERDELMEVVHDFNAVRAAAVSGAAWPTLHSTLSMERLAELWHMMSERYEEHNLIDLTGLLVTLVEQWKSNPESLKQCQERFTHVMVDEYQDMDALQIEMTRQLVSGQGDSPNLCVVGDPDQTIYSWRGANARSLADFMERYPDARSITLTQNYRTPRAILNGAEALILNNSHRLDKKLEATITSGPPLSLWEGRDEWKQTEMLFHLLEQYVSDQNPRSFGEIALLTRTHAQARMLAAQLAKKNYPFQTSTPSQFWAHPEIQKFLEKLHAIRQVGHFPEEAYEQKFSDWLREKLERFIWNQSVPEKKAMLLIQLLSHAMAYDHRKVPQALSEFLDATDTMQDVDNLVNDDRIHLMTIDASKGIEFPIVMVFGLEEGHFPIKKLLDNEARLEEERRLMFMGMTRAKEQLHLFRARTIDGVEFNPSRFLAEIGPEHMVYGHLSENRSPKKKPQQIKEAQQSLF